MAGRKTLTDLFAVMREPSLTPKEKVLWALVRSYDSGHGCWASNELLASHLGVCPRTVQRRKAELLRQGYLARELRGPNPAKWWALLPGQAASDLPLYGHQKLNALERLLGLHETKEETNVASDAVTLAPPEYAKYGSTPITAVSKYSETGTPCRNGNERLGALLADRLEISEEDEWP